MKRLACLALVFGFCTVPAFAYVDTGPTLGKVINDATNIVVVRVDKVNREKRAVIFQKVADLKGKSGDEPIKHQIGTSVHPREAKYILDWAEPGATAIFFRNAVSAYTCLGEYWYVAGISNDWWNANMGRPEGCWAYVGSIDKLRRHIVAMLDGKAVVITAYQYDLATVEAQREAVYARNFLDRKLCKVGRIKASLKMPAVASVLAQDKQWLVGPGAAAVEDVPALIEVLQSQEAAVRQEAAADLGTLGAQAKPALAALSRLLEDKDLTVRVSAAGALARIEPEPARAVGVLAEILKSPQKKHRRAAAEALGNIGPAAKGAVPALTAVLGDADPDMRQAAAEALEGIGPGAEAAVQPLVQALTDGNADVRGSAAEALGGIGSKEPAAIRALVAALQDKEAGVSRSAAIALVRLRVERTAAARVFVAQLANLVDSGAAGMLIKMGPEAAPAVAEGLQSADATLRYRCGQVCFYATWDQSAVPSLTGALQAKDVRSRRCAAIALGRIGPAGKAAVPVLTEALKDEDATIRHLAAHALGCIGPEAAAAVPALTEALKDANENVRKTAAEALRIIRKP
jgi:HEAT repeat protein